MDKQETGEASSSYDPLNVAKAEGKLFGAGASGKYRKTLVTRVGFFLLGILFIGISVVFYTFVVISPRQEITDFVVAGIESLWALGFFWLGVKFLKNIFRNS